MVLEVVLVVWVLKSVGPASAAAAMPVMGPRVGGVRF
jgi:hypothetical protein